MGNRITRESMNLIIEELLDIAATNCREKIKAARFEKVLVDQGLAEVIEEPETVPESIEPDRRRNGFRIIEKYVQIHSLDDATDEETVCALYPRAAQNVSGKKNDTKMLEAEKDALSGKCKLLVWRKIEIKE